MKGRVAFYGRLQFCGMMPLLGPYHPGADAIQVMTMHASEGLEFPVVALPGIGHMPAPGEDEKEAARMFYVAATRATQRLVMGVGGDGGFGQRLGT